KREEKAKEEAKKEFENHKNNSFFVFGLSMYWAEGSKKHPPPHFMNSDPRIISPMVKWFEKFLGYSKDEMKFRLYIHEPYKDENCEEFWSNVINVPSHKFKPTVYKPTKHSVKKNPDYKGCFRITIGGTHELRKLKAWQNLLSKYYSS
ncbi:MAG: hypothetical protein ABEH43_09015, partial [Flavobacteriales bacterium]